MENQETPDRSTNPNVTVIIVDSEEERNRLMSLEVQKGWQCLTGNVREQATISADLEKMESIFDCVNSINKQNSENLQQLQTHQNGLVDPAKALATKQQDVIKKLDSFEEQLNQFLASNLTPNDEIYDNKIRSLEERVKEQEKQKAIKLAILSKKEHRLCELKNELAERRKSERAARLELERRERQREAKREAWRKREAALLQNIENVDIDHDEKMSIIDGDIDTLQNLIEEEAIEYRAKTRKAIEEGSRLEDELKRLQEQLVQRPRNNATSAKSPAISLRSYQSSEFRKPLTANDFNRDFDRLKMRQSQRSNMSNSQMSAGEGTSKRIYSSSLDSEPDTSDSGVLAKKRRTE